MADITFKGKPIHTVGNLPSIGSKAPSFTLVRKDLSEATLDNYKGKKILLNLFPSLDTGVCAQSVRRFNALLAEHPEIAVLHISKDLPFAMNRFCSSESLPGAETLSAFNSNLGQDYGIQIKDGPLKGLLSRAAILLDEQGKIIYTEQVPEIAQEPNYGKILSQLGINEQL